MARALVALGSNLGDRAAALDAAAASLAGLADCQLLAASAWTQSPHVGGPPQPDYLNGAVLLETALAPLELLDRLQQVERAAGRVRTVYWGPRTLDLDLLLYDDAVIDTQRLQLPHPRLPFRRFALRPAAEIASTMRHPVMGVTIAELLRNWEKTKPYLALLSPPASGKTRLAEEISARTGCRVLLDPAADAEPSREDAAQGQAGGTRERAGNTPIPCGRGSHDLPARSRVPLAWPQQAGDSAGLEPAGEIQFLARRSHGLAGLTWSEGDRWTVSDFWLDQSLAWSLAEHPESDVGQVENAYRAYASQSVPARFVVALNSSDSTTDVAGDEFGRRLRTAMRGLAGRGGLPPVLWLSTGDWEKAVVEILAVLAG